MSVDSHQSNPAADISAIKDRAADWLERADRADWNERDAAELESWLSQTPANRLAYWRVKSAWERAQRLHALPKIEEVAPETRGRFWPALLKIAAAVSTIAFLGFAAKGLLPHTREQTFSTGIGGHKIVSFADGTEVELNTNTIIRTELSARERIIVLEKGEAYFQVAHNAARPFAVVAGDRRITDLGTKFLVRHDSARFEVALTEGRARFDASDGVNDPSVLLVPGDVVLEKNGALSLLKKNAGELADELGWRRGVLVFSHATLADAAAEFNRYNASKIVIADPATASITIGGTFATNNVGGFVRLARNLLGLHVEMRAEEIVISR